MSYGLLHHIITTEISPFEPILPKSVAAFVQAVIDSGSSPRLTMHTSNPDNCQKRSMKFKRGIPTNEIAEFTLRRLRARQSRLSRDLLPGNESARVGQLKQGKRDEWEEVDRLHGSYE